jgi:UDP-N-acetylglucosamine/UDP-N-acetylgalactosamine 4-epimerase
MNILVTGGAGFIGSNLVEALIYDERVNKVRILDDLSTGNFDNIRTFQSSPKFEFLEGSICNYDTCKKAVQDIDRISHQAALGSVPRSIINPLATNEVNVTGTLNLLWAAKEQEVDRIVMAFSSSVYGDDTSIPKKEDYLGRPLSPYAVSKRCGELYTSVFSDTYSLDYIGLRYFNVFGPKQDPNGAYAAVIPLFCKAFIKNDSPIIFGDGQTSRDFTYIQNVVEANKLALFTEDRGALNQIYNIACGEAVTLNKIVEHLQYISGKPVKPQYRDERMGDIKFSLASIERAKQYLGYQPQVLFEEGLRRCYQWYQKQLEQ